MLVPISAAVAAPGMREINLFESVRVSSGLSKEMAKHRQFSHQLDLSEKNEAQLLGI